MRFISLLLSCVLLSCANQPPLEERILGTWEGQYYGQTLTLIIDESTITPKGPIMGQSPYMIQGDILSFGMNGSMQSRRVSFTANDKMTLANEESGTATEFTRIPTP